MATFEIKAPNGDLFEVEAPDEASALAGFQNALANPDVTDQPLEQPQQQGMTEGDLLPQIASGLNEGIASIAGFPVDILSSGINLGTGGINAVFGTDIPQIQNPVGGSASIKGLMGDALIKPESEDQGSRIGRRIAQELGASIIPMGAGIRAGQLAGHSAQELARFLIGESVISAGSGVGAAGAKEIAPGNAVAEAVGQALGGLGTYGATRLAKRAITPFGGPRDATREAAAQTMEAEGVPLTAGQELGNKKLQYLEAELGGGRADNFTDQQLEDFTAAALRRIGSTERRATPEVLDQEYTRIGSEFEDIGARNTLQADQQLAADLDDAWRDYASVTNPSDRAPVIQTTIQEIAEAIRNNGGRIDGRTYTRLRSRLGQLARGSSVNERREALYGIQHALDDAFERSISQADAEDFAIARNEYRNFITLEQAATGAGEKAALGLISPAALRGATVAKQGRRNYGRGEGDFADLARSGVATMSPLPQSGTAPRLASQAMAAVPSVVGAALGTGIMPGAGTVAGALTGAAVPSLVGRALMSGPGRAYLTNQLLAGATPGRGVSAIAGALANQNANTREPIRITVRGGAK
jgi:hypothetical protein